MKARRSLTRSFGSAMGARLGIALLNYGLFWALAHLFDDESLGAFSLLMSVFLMVQLLPLLGLVVPIVRRIAVATDDSEHEIANAFFFALPQAIAIALLIGSWGQHAYGSKLAPGFWLVAAAMLPTAWTTVAEAALIGKEKYGDLARITLVESFLRTVLALLSVRFGLGLTGVFAVFFGMRVVGALLFARHVDLPLPRWRCFSWAMQGRNWREVPVFLGIAIVTALVSRLDVLVLSHIKDLREVGVYSAAARLYEASLMVPTVLLLVLMPMLVRQFAAAREQFIESLTVVVRTSMTLGIGIALPASAVSPWVIGLLYRPDMQAAGAVLGWLAFAAAIMLTDVILSATMVAAHAQKHDLHSLTIGLAVLAIGLFGLLPSLGAVGAAMALVLALAARILYRLRWAERELGMPHPWLNVARLCMACGIGIAAMVQARPFGVASSAGAALLCYGAVVLLTGGFGRNPMLAMRADIALLKRRSAG